MRSALVLSIVLSLLTAWPAKNRAETVDRSDPQQVAEAFWNAVIDKDRERAKEQVASEARATFDTDFEHLFTMFNFGKDAKILADIVGGQGVAKIRMEAFRPANLFSSVGLVSRDDAWWIVKNDPGRNRPERPQARPPQPGDEEIRANIGEYAAQISKAYAFCLAEEFDKASAALVATDKSHRGYEYALLKTASSSDPAKMVFGLPIQSIPGPKVRFAYAALDPCPPEKLRPR